MTPEQIAALRPLLARAKAAGWTARAVEIALAGGR